MPKQIAIIIVSYNTKELLRLCLTSIEQSIVASDIDKSGVRVIVVDNASQDGSAEMVAADFPQLTLVALDENIGFTRANNLALSKLGIAVQSDSGANVTGAPDYVLLLNPDAVLVDDALDQMVDFLEKTPSAGACGANLTFADGTFQHGAFRFPSPMQVALDLLPVYAIPGANRLYAGGINGRYPLPKWQSDTPFAVDFVLGACMMMRGAALEQVGVLDESYFMYCEEMDWCMRAAKYGWITYSVPSAHVVHHEAQSSRQAPWSSFCNLWRSRFRFYTKHRRQFPLGNLIIIRTILRNSLRIRRALAFRSFAHGKITGLQLQRELDAYHTVGRM